MRLLADAFAPGCPDLYMVIENVGVVCERVEDVCNLFDEGVAGAGFKESAPLGVLVGGVVLEEDVFAVRGVRKGVI